MAFAFRYEGSLPSVLSSELHRPWLGKGGAVDMGDRLQGQHRFQALYRWVKRRTNWELGFKQYSFHHLMQVLRNNVCQRLLSVLRFTTMLCSPLPFGFRWGS